MSALVEGGHFEGAAGACRCLFEYQGDVLAFQAGLLGTGVLGALEVGCQVKEEFYFPWGEVQQLKKAAVSKIECHIVLIVKELSLCRRRPRKGFLLRL